MIKNTLLHSRAGLYGSFLLLMACSSPDNDAADLHNVAGKSAEGSLQPFLTASLFDRQEVFNGQPNVREPYLAVATDGSILALRNRARPTGPAGGILRRSEDGGYSWGEPMEVPFGFRDSNFIVDDQSGDLLVIRMWDSEDRKWRSADHGQTWKEERMAIQPNEVMKWLERTDLKIRTTADEPAVDAGSYYLHANASERGITLRHGDHAGRLIVSATFRPHASEHPSDRKPVDAIYSCAVYSDDGGNIWQMSGFFPEGYTEEAALVELQDGRLYYNSRSHSGYRDNQLARSLRTDESMRREAWSYDGGQTWEGLRISEVLTDGGGYGRGYGLKGGLVRLPVKDHDILLYSNTDTDGGAREKLTVWASFDGGKTWPVKRLVHSGPAAYSSLDAGRPQTPSEGMIYLLFEGGKSHHYEAMHVVRFNLTWLLEQGERTGDGTLPSWTGL